MPILTPINSEITSNIPTGATTSTSSSIASSSSNILLLASNTDRAGATIYNDSTSILYVKLGTGCTTSSFTCQLPPCSYYEVPTPVFQGEIDGFWATINGNARITEMSF
jgi:hypothetical protein